MLPPLEIDTIKQQLSVTDVPDIELLDSVDSTSTRVRQQVRAGHGETFACFAEQQSAGRGRRGGRWVSPPGSNIYMSLAWPFTRPVNELGGLPMAIAVAIKQTLQRFGIAAAELKWPNDVLVDSRKLAGVLIEPVTRGEHACTAVIGIGLNVKLPSVVDIDSAWTDMASVLEHDTVLDRSVIAGVLLNECMTMCQHYQQQGLQLLPALQQHYRHYQQQPVRLRLDSGDVLDGIALGVTDIGELRVLVDGHERVFNSADVSLRQVS